jgi:segregation and condensation protein B
LPERTRPFRAVGRGALVCGLGSDGAATLGAVPELKTQFARTAAGAQERQLHVVANPVDRLARAIEALLVVASQPLSVEELAEATGEDPERIETALGLLAERYREGRSGIVLERVAGGYAFGAAREAAEACARLFERPVERGLSQAALETLAIVAYLGPVSRPDIARLRGVAADSVVAGLVERGLITESGREEGGAVRYRVTPLFERLFGLETLSELPRLDDLGADAAELRDRLEQVAGARSA